MWHSSVEKVVFPTQPFPDDVETTASDIQGHDQHDVSDDSEQVQEYTDSNVIEDLGYDEDVLAFPRGTNSQSCPATDVSSVLCSLCTCHCLIRPMKLLVLSNTHYIKGFQIMKCNQFS